MTDIDPTPLDAAQPDAPVIRRTRPKRGERRIQILQALAEMLEQPGGERVTTAALAARLDVSEAALYRHFASKAQMFEGLIEFIEESVFALVSQVESQVGLTGGVKAASLVTLLIKFAEKNRGMTRVMVGDALVLEHERLQLRMNLFFDKLEAALKQFLRNDESSSSTPTVDVQVRASVLMAFTRGRLQRFARSGFKRSPSEHLAACLAQVL
jgi:TetR/AcrR family transcriptional regulator